MDSTYILKKEKFGTFGVLNIGKTETSIKNRVQHYFTLGKKDKSVLTNQRIHSAIKQFNAMKITWKISDKATDIERKLLGKYYKNHRELPPFNRNNPKVIRKNNLLSSSNTENHQTLIRNTNDMLYENKYILILILSPVAAQLADIYILSPLIFY